MNIKNLIKIALACAMFYASPSVYAAEPSERPVPKGQGGNGQGGGGITRNGRYMTFYSAGFYTEPLEATSDEVPQLAQLIHFFNTNAYISELTKVKYASKLMPSSVRKYYRVQANTFTPEVRARLLEEYGRVMKVNVNEVALFAITDTENGTTYLFPEYFSLKPTEQQAILFHEIYWLINPKATYAQVIDAEMSFQAHIENLSSPEKLVRWLKTSGTHGDVLISAIKSDLKTGAMNGLVKDDNISILNLLGTQFINCKKRGLGQECTPFISTHVYALSQRYPNSLFIKVYSESVNGNRLKINVNNYKSLLFDEFDLKNLFDRYILAALPKESLSLSSIDYSGGSEFIMDMISNPPRNYFRGKIKFNLNNQN